VKGAPGLVVKTLCYNTRHMGRARACRRGRARARLERLGLWCLLVGCLGAGLTVVRPLDAASFTLTPEQRDAAITMGKRSITSDEFGREWRVSGDGTSALTVMTPFYRLALAARNSAFKGQDLAPKEIESVLKEQEGAVTFWATFRGGKSDFARFYRPMLLNGQQEVKASFAQNERTARGEPDGSYTARCVYVFPIEGLKPDDRVTLVVRDFEDKPVAKFTVDLSAMR